MNKQTYLKIRAELDFAPKGARVAGHLLQDILLTLTAAALALSGKAWAWALAQALLAALYFRAFGLMHDAAHGALSPYRRVNDWLGVVYGGVCFLPFTSWRAVHLEHHAWAGNFDKDPVMKIVREFPSKSETRKGIDSLLWRSWIPYVALLQEMVFWSVSAKLLFERDKFKGQYGELFLSVSFSLAVCVGLAAAGHALGSIFLFAPSVILYLVMVEVVNFPHHLRLPRVTGEAKLSLWEQYKISRTCVYAPWFSRFVLLNFNFHAEHHMFPTLPWYELPKAHAHVSKHAPAGYQMICGHEWIRVNRGLSLKEVFAPTEILHPESDEKKRAA